MAKVIAESEDASQHGASESGQEEPVGVDGGPGGTSEHGLE